MINHRIIATKPNEQLVINAKGERVIACYPKQALIFEGFSFQTVVNTLESQGYKLNILVWKSDE